MRRAPLLTWLMISPQSPSCSAAVDLSLNSPELLWAGPLASVSYDVRECIPLVVFEVSLARRRNKEGCLDLPAFPKTGYFLLLRIMSDCEDGW